jgi:hypothetical protein
MLAMSNWTWIPRGTGKSNYAESAVKRLVLCCYSDTSACMHTHTCCRLGEAVVQDQKPSILQVRSLFSHAHAD